MSLISGEHLKESSREKDEEELSRADLPCLAFLQCVPRLSCSHHFTSRLLPLPLLPSTLSDNEPLPLQGNASHISNLYLIPLTFSHLPDFPSSVDLQRVADSKDSTRQTRIHPLVLQFQPRHSDHSCTPKPPHLLTLRFTCFCATASYHF
ncbi:hypothetical protein LIA77_09790 [Sarocladium implicatum]|nr:hypothetical protein LIA77_09790 [Sarocladium implicatum]